MCVKAGYFLFRHRSTIFIAPGHMSIADCGYWCKQ